MQYYRRAVLPQGLTCRSTRFLAIPRHIEVMDGLLDRNKVDVLVWFALLESR